ncbi:coiled-coil domain-containing protein 160 [Latimeria chalumnae]|uniref:coiled-coil domain-containing protein 160 n=1 Tax=Latimeria chalumnae TaxID=7897 RepID=UPI0003C172C2|nr:PREDICTED: coiled-coil domain-containing protein 160 [Latimeria chalumnae]XP_005990429.1 PREDICTED: coiled-coil domain-containing protein 160 [Latimeria chalumnae]|eukprot:XP_005990428.1 PREDICTED: coiled-coil domain-containing protein 160 [Latimeria chalumnae]
MEDAEEQHWVEELFPPHFNVEDLLGGKSHHFLISEKLASDRAKRVEEIYSVAVKQFQEEQKLKQKEYISKMTVREYKMDLCQTEKDSKGWQNTAEEKRAINCKRSDMLTSVEEGIKEIENHCIWTDQELALLRQAMFRKDLEGHFLKTQLLAMKTELENLKAKYKNLEDDLETKDRKLSESKQEMHCRTVHLEQIERENLKKDFELQTLKKDLQERSASMRVLNKELRQIKIQIQDLHFKNKELAQELKKLKQQHESEKLKMMEDVKIQYSLKVKKLQKEVETIKIELNTEKLQHARHISALEVLRKHFASLPLSNAVDEFRVKLI